MGSVTLMEGLQNADYNLRNAFAQVQIDSGKRQLHNVVTLLDKGYTLEDNFDEIMEKYQDVDDVPDRV